MNKSSNVVLIVNTSVSGV